MKRACGFVFALLHASIVAGAATPATFRNARIETTTAASPAEAVALAGGDAAAVWVGWSLPAVNEAADLCCWTNGFSRRECSLADRDSSWGSSDTAGTPVPTELFVLVEVSRGRTHRIRILSPTCPLNGSDRRLVWMGAVEPSASLDFLGRLIDGGADLDDVKQPALAAAAFHADARADALLERVASNRSAPEELRHQALFWAGDARGEAGYRLLDKVLGSDADGDTRRQAIFALTQSHVSEATDRIKRAATADRDSEVRGQALFWLADSNSPGAGEWILGRLDAERDPGVREQAVFALSQLDDGTDWLLKLLRSKRDPEILRRTLFWLGQSDDPRALHELEKILDR